MICGDWFSQATEKPARLSLVRVRREELARLSAMGLQIRGLRNRSCTAKRFSSCVSPLLPGIHAATPATPPSAARCSDRNSVRSLSSHRDPAHCVGVAGERLGIPAAGTLQPLSVVRHAHHTLRQLRIIDRG